MAREGLMYYSVYEFTECEKEASCGRCGNKDCIWYDDFLDEEQEDD